MEKNRKSIFLILKITIFEFLKEVFTQKYYFINQSKESLNCL